MSVRDKWVRRFSVDETSRHKNGFTIYKITSVLFPLHSPAAVTVVSVWKRYSEVQRLHAAMRALHGGLQLGGTFPPLSNWSYFKRFSKEVIEDRARSIVALLEFVAEHKLLFASTEFVNFLQSGHPPPTEEAGCIDSIRKSLQLPVEGSPPLEYQPEGQNTHTHNNRTVDAIDGVTQQELNRIPIYEAADVEIRESPKHETKRSNSFDSISSMESLCGEFYAELSKITIDDTKPSVKTKPVLPDLINFDEPSTSAINFDDYHNMNAGNTDSETVSLNSTLYDSNVDVESMRSSKLSTYSKQNINASLSDVASKTRTEDSYVFEAGYKINMAKRCESVREYQKAFDCYKAGIEMLLIGAQTDASAARRALVRRRTHQYLSHAETLHRTRLGPLAPPSPPSPPPARSPRSSPRSPCRSPCPSPRRPRSSLAEYRLLGVMRRLMLVLNTNTHTCNVIKVIEKIPNNLTEFDEYIHKRTNDTKIPILPTNIPYMVPLHSYVETDDLIFLILAYAPGEKLVDYVKKYVRSMPNTPSRDVNLENVFEEPHKKASFGNYLRIGYIDDETTGVERDVDSDMSVNELVRNSQKLLKDVDRALRMKHLHVDKEGSCNDNVEIQVVDKGMGKKCEDSNVVIESPKHLQSAIRVWASELLVALDALHRAGVVCRDLDTEHVLLGGGGHVVLTYRVGYPSRSPSPCSPTSPSPRSPSSPPRAPELCACWCREEEEALADYWTYGAILYELICGVPVTYYHRSVFTSHTILQMPEGVDIEAASLLTQLLVATPGERLGAGGVHEIQEHPYFKRIDWDRVQRSAATSGVLQS